MPLCPLCYSHLLKDGPGNQRGVQKHDGNHPSGQKTDPQVQPTWADRQAADFSCFGSLLRHCPLHPQEAPLPLYLKSSAASFLTQIEFKKISFGCGVEVSGSTCNEMVWNQHTQKSFNSNERNDVANAPHCLNIITWTNWIDNLCLVWISSTINWF